VRFCDDVDWKTALGYFCHVDDLKEGGTKAFRNEAGRNLLFGGEI